MADKRKPWETKTFWGAVAYAALVVLQQANIALPYDALVSLVTVWTGYSIADRLRK